MVNIWSCNSLGAPWAKGGDQSASVDGQDGQNDTGQEDGRQLVDILDAHKDQGGQEQ